MLHLGQHSDEWDLDLGIELGQAEFVQSTLRDRLDETGDAERPASSQERLVDGVLTEVELAFGGRVAAGQLERREAQPAARRADTRSRPGLSR